MCYHRVNREGQTMSSSYDKKLMIFLHYPIIFKQLKKDKKLLLFETSLIDSITTKLSWLVISSDSKNDYLLLYDVVKKNLNLTFYGAKLLRLKIMLKKRRFIFNKIDKQRHFYLKLLLDIHQGNKNKYLFRLQKEASINLLIIYQHKK